MRGERGFRLISLIISCCSLPSIQHLALENPPLPISLDSAVLRVLRKLFCHLLPLDKFGYLCAQRGKHR